MQFDGGPCCSCPPCLAHRLLRGCHQESPMVSPTHGTGGIMPTEPAQRRRLARRLGGPCVSGGRGRGVS